MNNLFVAIPAVVLVLVVLYWFFLRKEHLTCQPDVNNADGSASKSASSEGMTARGGSYNDKIRSALSEGFAGGPSNKPWSEEIGTRFVDAKVKENHQEWVKDRAVYGSMVKTGPTMAVDTELEMGSSVPWVGLRRPSKPVPVGNPSQEPSEYDRLQEPSVRYVL